MRAPLHSALTSWPASQQRTLLLPALHRADPQPRVVADDGNELLFVRTAP